MMNWYFDLYGIDGDVRKQVEYFTADVYNLLQTKLQYNCCYNNNLNVNMDVVVGGIIRRANQKRH